MIRWLALALALWASPARAADFSGKTITLLVGLAAGGEAEGPPNGDGSANGRARLRPDPSFERTAALYAGYLGRYLTGEPDVVARKAPGADGLIAAQRLAQSSASDGTTLAVFGATAVRAPLFQTRGATFDPARFGWIGARAEDATVCVLRAELGVRRIADLGARALFLGAVDPRALGFIEANALRRVTGAPLRIITGYTDLDEAISALPKGEIDGLCGWSLASLRTRYADLLAEGKLSIIAQFTRDKEPRFAYAPSGREIAKSDEDRAVMGLLDDQSLFRFALAAPPSTSPEALADLRRAFAMMTRDPDFNAEAAASGLDVIPVSGETLAVAAASLYDAKPEVISVLRGLAQLP